MRKVSADGLSMRSVAAARRVPIGSRCDQRASDAITSSPVTAAPSWNFRPGRRVNTYVSLSGDTVQACTICGCGRESASSENKVS
ncbi:hypothetical protein D3C71_1928840 [compost metagenome]